LNISAGVAIGRISLLWVNKKAYIPICSLARVASLITVSGRREKCDFHLLVYLHWVRCSPLFSGLLCHQPLFRLEFVVWFVPSLVGNAVAVCFIGVLMGPMYPIAANHAKKILPARMLTGAIGWMAGFGQTGSALVPFMTGAIANKHGLKTMPPVYVKQFMTWTTLPLTFDSVWWA